MRILVTGGAGFIGSEFVHQILLHQKDEIAVLDSLTYAGRLENLSAVKDQVNFYKIDISNKLAVEKLFAAENFDVVVHFAAESHVDNSLENPNTFLRTNVEGTLNLVLECIKKPKLRFIQISTDEVYGSTTGEPFDEQSAFHTSSPYSASKAAAELLVTAYTITDGLRSTILRCSNNYGPRQDLEKFIPKVISNAINGKEIPVYGSGTNIREWIHVSDCVGGIIKVVNDPESEGIYNISSHERFSNLEIIDKISDQMEGIKLKTKNVSDRKGHDFRYAINSTKFRAKYDWEPVHTIDTGLRNTVKWYFAEGFYLNGERSE
jgi:dTDP-glucose 4,6-dehydratase